MTSTRHKAPSVAEQLDQICVEEVLAAHIPARLRPLARKLLSKKAQPPRAHGRPVKWNGTELTVLRDEYQALKAGGMEREAVLEFLAQRYRLSSKAIEKLYTRANSPEKARRKSI